MLKILKHLRSKEWLFILASVVLIVGQVWLDLKLPDYMSRVTALLSTGMSRLSDILLAGAMMLLCALGSLALSVCVGFFAAQTASRFSRRLRSAVYDKVMSFGDEEINRFSTASLITRSTNDITNVQMLIAMGLQVIVKAPIMAGMAITKISTKGIEWTLLTAGVVVFIVILLAFVMIFALPRFKKIQWLTDDLNAVTRENLNGIMVVRAYNAEKYHEEKFDNANNALTTTNLQAHIAMSVMNPGLNLAMNGLSLGIYWIGAVLIQNTASMAQKVTVFSDMVVFMSYAMQVVMAFLMLVMIFIMLPRAAVSAKRINEVLDTKPVLKNGNLKKGEDGKKGEIEFKNVSFRYPGSSEYVIENISFKANTGDTIAIIGPTGSGKSTIINLIPRLYDVSKGEVIVNGKNVKDYDKRALNDLIGFVPQKAYLFSGTVKSNVGYGMDNISESEIDSALKVAQASNFVNVPEVGLDGYVAQTGSNFSGGQKQRLSIARAVAKRPEILVFDDSFSALDYRTDKILRTALKKEAKDATKIIVAQRIGTITDADLILVIEAGNIVGKGTHKELLKTCEVYKEIAYSQLSKEELAV